MLEDREAIRIREDLVQKLEAEPYFSSMLWQLTYLEHRGRALALLKVKAKPRQGGQKRKRHEIEQTLAQYREEVHKAVRT